MPRTRRPRSRAASLAERARIALALALAFALGGCDGPRVGAGSSDPAPAASAPAVTVQWQPWTRASFARARAQQRIILINVAASWCHWCHVMDETTYGDPEIAALLADAFVTIRVDADARPDLAERYLEWGWPATALLTPDARPIMELRGFQQPARFKALLRGLVAAQRDGTLNGRRPAPEPPPGDRSLVAVRDATRAQLDRYWREREGGWSTPKKYPHAAAIEHSLQRARLSPARPPADASSSWRARALRTLELQTALIDPVWGGVYQYSVGDVWTRPHFEKLGALQALTLESYALAYREQPDPRWRAAAHDIRRYVLTFLRDERGGFYTSQDADLVRDDHGASIPGAEYFAHDDAGRRALGIPRVDRSVYADVNGHMIRALCRLHALVPGPQDTVDTVDTEALAAARASAAFLRAHHRRPDGGYTHGADEGEGGIRYLRDQSAVGRGLLELYRVTGERAWLDEARAVADFALAELQDAARGGFFAQTVDPAAAGVFQARRRPLREVGDMARFLVELHRALDHEAVELPYETAARRAVTALSAPQRVARWGRLVGEYLLAIEALLLTPIDLTIVGAPQDPRARALLQAALRLPEPRVGVEWSEPGARYPAPGGRPVVYLCSDTACSRPITDPEALAPELTRFVAQLTTP